ncbi:helix-turn-helix domain-containing protein [Virgibacillus salexigens]|uniref:HTH cro/C1-type domain-containing protein n=1 Tax=Virgibacillus kapii TaxID=1638645 RepID=A0ABQ2DG96_9BACI|nr:helix-turn-helix transcriptional regulator [Virgibacillus kapii]GGJ56897.1 hypothetical protein GCM10007111_18800 [Virgibacillus kapii]
MYEGKILKFYREKAKITQEQLGRGICSVTHISKIERGLTEYSPEITMLLAQRLNINMEQETANLINLKKKLDQWHEMIISQDYSSATTIYDEFQENEMIIISEYYLYYLLLKGIYHLKQGFIKEAGTLIKTLQKKRNKLNNYEENLMKHVLGIYFMMTDDHLKSIHLLKSIQFDIYSNALVYYDLAAAYHHIHSPVLAYYYGEKALNAYKKKNYFLGVIDTENLMLIEVESGQHRNFKETKEQYQDLIRLCDLCNSPDKKGKILHNFAYEHLKRKKYHEAGKLYKASMDLKEKKSNIYLLSLEGYVRCANEGDFLEKDQLISLIEEGLSIASEIKEPLYNHVFLLHYYTIFDQEKQYYHYLTEKALPYFKEHGFFVTMKRYEKELFNYFLKTEQWERAVQTADNIINKVDDTYIF